MTGSCWLDLAELIQSFNPQPVLTLFSGISTGACLFMHLRSKYWRVQALILPNPISDSRVHQMELYSSMLGNQRFHSA